MNEDYKLYIQLFQGKSPKKLKEISESPDYSEAARAAARDLFEAYSANDGELLNEIKAEKKRAKAEQNNLLAFGKFFRLLAFGKLFGFTLAGIRDMVFVNVAGFVSMLLTGVVAFLICFVFGSILCFIGKRVKKK